MYRSIFGIAAAAATLAAAPAASAQPAVALLGGGANDAIATLDTDAPGVVSSSRAVTGLVPGERLVGIDYRWIPLASSGATPGLYGLGVNAGTGDAHVYRIEVATGVATPLGAGFNRPAGTEYGFDFNPAVDRIRVVTSADDNFRLNPDNGAFAAADTALSPAGQTIAGAAYDRVNNAPTVPAGPTTLFVIDPVTDRLATQGGVNSTPSPNGGVLDGFGSLGVDASVAGLNFDIAYDGTAFATLTVGGVPGLYEINKGTGAATLLGNLTQTYNGFAILPGTAQFAVSSFSNSERTNATINVTRTGSTAEAATVKFATGGGTADAADYKATSGTLTFAAGQATRSFPVELTDDSIREDDETVGLTLTDPSSGITLGSPATATLTIIDNDGPAVVLPPAADTTPPTLSLKTVRSSYSRSAFLKGITVRVTTNESARVEATLNGKVKRATAARVLAGAYNLELTGKKLGAGTGTRTIKLRPKSALFGKPGKSVKVKLRVLATDAAGNDRTVTKIITVKR